MKNTRTWMLLAVFALVVAACGTETEATTTSGEGGGGETTTTQPSPTGGAGEGGELLLLEWQAATHLNPYTGTGTKDIQAASLVIEPLVEYDTDGNIVPSLVTEIPTLENGGISEDLTQITYHLLPDVTWSNGDPFTADDVVFTWEYCTQSEGCSSSALAGVESVEAVDDLTVTITFPDPTPWPFNPFTGSTEPVLHRADFEGCVGEGFVACESNINPIGTGPYMVSEMRVDDTVTYEMNPNYRGVADGKPFFSTVTIKGGGSAEDAARAVLSTGEADYAWNLQVAPEILSQMEGEGNGTVSVGFNTSVEGIRLNQTNPDNPDNPSDYLDGTNPNPFFFENADLARALSLAINRDEVAAVAYGAAGEPTCNVWPVPGAALSTNNDWCLTQDIDEANRILDEDLGYVDSDGDGIRELPDGTPLEWDYVTSTNQVRQDTQALVESYWSQIGVKVNMGNEDAGVFFDRASDLGIWKFFTDIEMYTNSATGADAQGYFQSFLTSQIPESSNDWGGNNIPRCARDDFDTTWQQLAGTELTDPARDDLIIQLNDMFVEYCMIPLINRGSVSAFANDLEGYDKVNGWDTELWNIEDWRRSS
ncbi:MAG TPA: peptide ABC transporter substrate-binding protein [Acidimicrobiia bacterium]|nr:peptide ABC transporter substrate-binding protein [Acidimicrobiia bacterium]